MNRRLCCAAMMAMLVLSSWAAAAVYEVGPGKALAEVGDAPWERLQAGDTVLIHARPEPYKTKWVICRRGTAQQWITVRGVAGPNGELPVIDGEGATTPARLNFWGEARGVVKVGGANTPADVMPAYIAIENLDIRGGRAPLAFTGRGGAPGNYARNCAAVFLEKGEHIIVRNCALHGCGNGFFASGASKDVLVEGCHIYDNGAEGSIYEHNNYTEAAGITFQFNHFGPLRAGCPGNNLKDRSAGLVVRYNWLEGGNRQLDLVDSGHMAALPEYRATFVYGNVFVEPDGAGNRQIVHYGGDQASTASYRKGTLYFYNNTVVSTRKDRTTLFRLSTNEEHCDARNNIFYVTAPGGSMAVIEDHGAVEMRNNWLKRGWVKTFSFAKADGVVNDLGGELTGEEPGFVNAAEPDFHLSDGSPCVDKGGALAAAATPENGVTKQYVKHQRGEARPTRGALDLGAYETAPSGAASGKR